MKRAAARVPVGSIWLSGWAAFFVLFSSCQTTPPLRREISEVLAAHDEALLAIPGVVGVYVGAWPRGGGPCLTVMLADRSAAVRKRIPHEIEGYRVRCEVTGKMVPMRVR